MFKWIKKKILKWVLKDIIKDVPTFKKEVLKVVEMYGDEFLDNAKAQIKLFAKEFFVSKISNNSQN